MALSILTPADREPLERFLRQRLEHSMFLLSNLRTAGMDDRGGPFDGIYAAAWDGDEIVGVVCHYRRGNLAINAPSDAVSLAAAVLDATGRPMLGAVGPEAQVDAVTEALAIPSDPRTVQCDEREILYRLELDRLRCPPTLRDGSVVGRLLEERDVPTVIEWTVRYRVESVGDPEDDALWDKVRESIPHAVGRGDVWVLEHDGQRVAKTAFNARLPDAVQIGGVFTPSALRSRGHGRAAVASHLRWARDQGVDTAILFAGRDNPAARRAYEAIGFEAIGRYRVLILHPPGVRAP